MSTPDPGADPGANDVDGGRCPATHPETGARCTLTAGHWEARGTTHQPEEPAPAAPTTPERVELGAAGRYHKDEARKAAQKAAQKSAETARLATVDAAVEAGRRGQRTGIAPPGTYPVREKKQRPCPYGCAAPAQDYMNGPACAAHAPAALRALLEHQEPPT